MGRFLQLYSLVRFYRMDTGSGSDESVALWEAALEVTSDDDHDKVFYLGELGHSLTFRFVCSGNIDDLNRGIAYSPEAVNLTPNGHPSKPEYLNDLGLSLQCRFERLGDLDDLNLAIELGQAAVELTPDGNSRKPVYLGNLGNSIMDRFSRLGDLEDLTHAIACHTKAINIVSDSDPEKPAHLYTLGNCFNARFNRLGDLDDINKSIELIQEAVRLAADDHPEKSRFLNRLGDCFTLLFRHDGRLESIQEGIEHHQEALNLIQEGNPMEPWILWGLAQAFLFRFLRFGSLQDIDKSIGQCQAAIHSLPDDHPDKRLFLLDLGNALMVRFQRLATLDDIDEAITQHRNALGRMPEGHTVKPMCLSSLGSSLMHRFKKTGNPDDISDSINQHMKAADLCPAESVYKYRFLNNLASSLRYRFEKLGNLDDIDGSIAHYQAAADNTPDDHLNKFLLLDNLGSSLLLRFERLKNHEDIHKSIEHHQRSISLIPKDHPDTAMYSTNLGKALWMRACHFNLPKSTEEAIRHVSSAALSNVGPPLARFQAAKLWITISSSISPASVIPAYECALSIMPFVAWLGLPLGDRHQHLAQMGEIARDAAAAAISQGQCEKAVEWLEQGRSIVWTQILQLRTPVDRLRDVDSNLAYRLSEISQLIDCGVGVEAGQINEQGLRLGSPEEEGRKYRALVTERETLISSIRSLPGFEDFLRPLRISRLVKSAQNGPVVVLNIAKERCDALALVTGLDDVIHIPLQGLTYHKAIQLRDELKDLLSKSGIRLRAPRAAKRAKEESDDEACKFILSELWDNLVKPVLDLLGFSPGSDQLPRIWWCTTGPLSFLPLHAAGKYDLSSVGSQLKDYAISSYAPTLSSLLEPSPSNTSSSFQLLSVIEPSPPGASYIPNTKLELENIKHHLVNRDHVVLESEQATKEHVTRAMKSCNWIHLACHGVQKPIEPTKSALLLHNGPLTVEQIIKLDLPQAEFAFLSACQTIAGDEKLSEEAVHIAGGMLLSGYRSVVATMWSIQDELAPEVTDMFYAHIMGQKGRPDSRKAAEALHIAIQKLREKRHLPLTAWVPFVHVGI